MKYAAALFFLAFFFYVVSSINKSPRAAELPTPIPEGVCPPGSVGGWIDATTVECQKETR